MEKPKLFEIAGKFQEIQDEYQLEASNLIKYPRPLGAQIEALYELKQTRLEGWIKVWLSRPLDGKDFFGGI